MFVSVSTIEWLSMSCKLGSKQVTHSTIFKKRNWFNQIPYSSATPISA